MSSKFLTLSPKDLGKGVIIAILVAVLGFIQQLIKDKGLDITGADLGQIGEVAVLAFIAYLSKNLLSNSEDKFGKAEKKV